MLTKFHKRKIIISLLLVVAVVIFYIIYKSVDPSDAVYMPKCFSYTIFGIKCPGCGTQRAIHSIFTGDFSAAFRFNPLIVLSIPYMLLIFILDISSVKTKYPKLRNIFLGERAIWILLAVLVLYTILRNFFDF